MVYVQPHRRRNGSYVRGHYRRPPSRRFTPADALGLLVLLVILAAIFG